MLKFRPIALAFLLSTSAGCSVLGPGPQDSQLLTPTTIRTRTLAPAPTLPPTAAPDPSTTAVARGLTLGIPPQDVPTPTVLIENQGPSELSNPDPSRLQTATPFLGPTPAVFHFESPTCTIAFDVPAGWEVVASDREPHTDEECSIGIRPPGWPEIVEQSEFLLNDYPIFGETYPLPLEKATLLGMFVEVDARWFIMGRAIGEAQLVQDGGRTILRGHAHDGRMTKAHGSYAGLNPFTRAVLNEGSSFSVVLEVHYEPIDGPITLEEAFELVLRTFTFPRAGN